MARRKKMTPEERERLMSILQVPPDTTLPDRLIKIIEYTSLSFRGLLEKWLHEEEASIEAAVTVQWGGRARGTQCMI
jgi:hypothetical protein